MNSWQAGVGHSLLLTARWTGSRYLQGLPQGRPPSPPFLVRPTWVLAGHLGPEAVP